MDSNLSFLERSHMDYHQFTMKKAGLLGLGCLVWFVAVGIALVILAAVSGPRTGSASTSSQFVAWIGIAAYLFYAVDILRS